MSVNVNIGDLKSVIEIQEKKTIVDSAGFQTEEWVTIAKTRAKTEFDDRLMREVFLDDGITTTIVKIFTFRYFPNLTEQHRIFFKGKAFEIYGINNLDDTNRFLKVWGRNICQ